MKILFVFGNAIYFNAYENVVRLLCRNGHYVKILHGEGRRSHPVDLSLRAMKAEVKNCESGPLRLRRKWQWLLYFTRRLLNRTPYLNPQHPSPWLVNRKTGFSRPMRILLDIPPAKALLKNKWFQQQLRKVEIAIPPDQAILRWLEEHRPDVVVASPCLYGDHHETEYIKAAGALGIPTIVALYSWDHLMTKGTFHIIPDWTLVWNQVLVDDAVRFHYVPKDKIFITGAPHFDTWFNMQPALDRAAFCRQVGLDPNRPFVTYICSSLKGNEAKLVEEFARTLATNPDTRHLAVLIRPYPSKPRIWDDFEEENVVVWPKVGTIPDTPNAKSDYFHTFYYGIATVGISTTAFLEAAVIDRPCVTIMTEAFRYEHRMGHFRYLLNADFLEGAHSFDEAAHILGDILNGADAKAENRHRFVREFIRPWGMDRSASLVMAKVVETAARRQPICAEEFVLE